MYPVLACKLRWKKEVLLTNFRKTHNPKQFKSEVKVKKNEENYIFAKKIALYLD